MTTLLPSGIQHADAAWDNMLAQHAAKPRTEALVRALYPPMQSLYAAMIGIQEGSRIDQAEGVILDANASNVGIARSLPKGLSRRYFGFIDQAGAEPFGKAPIRNHRDSSTIAFDMPDEYFRLAIQAKVVLNNSNGTVEDILSVAEILFETTKVRVAYVGPGQVNLYIGREVTPDEPAVQIIQSLLPQAAGVMVSVFGVQRSLEGTMGGFTFTRATEANRPELPFQRVAVDTPRFTNDGMLVIDGDRTLIQPRARNPFGTGWSNVNLNVTTVDGPDGGVGTARLVSDGTAAGAHGSNDNPFFDTVAGQAFLFQRIYKPGTCKYIQIYARTASFGTATWANFIMEGDGSIGSMGAGALRPRCKLLADGWYLLEVVFLATATTTANGGSFDAMITTATQGRSETYTGTNRTFTAFLASSTALPHGSSPVIPAVGSTALERAADDRAIMTVPKGIGGVGVRFRFPRLAPTGSGPWVVWHQDDDSLANRISLRLESDGTLRVVQVKNSSDTTIINLGAILPETTYVVVVGWTATSLYAKMRGGTLQSVATTPPLTLSKLRAGGVAGWGAPSYVHVGPLDFYQTPPDADSALAEFP